MLRWNSPATDLWPSVRIPIVFSISAMGSASGVMDDDKKGNIIKYRKTELDNGRRRFNMILSEEHIVVKQTNIYIFLC